MNAPIKAPNLYSLENGYRELVLMMERIDEEGLDGDAAIMVSTWLASLDGEMKAKLESAGKCLRIFEVDAEGTEAEIERLRVRAAQKRRAAERLKSAIKMLLEVASMTRVEAGTFTFAIRTNGGNAPVEIDDVDANMVAAERPDLVVTKTTVNNAAVREALARGETLPFARVKPRGTHLQVK